MATVVRSTPETFSQSHLLRHFAPNNRHLFPVQVKVLECDDPVSVLDNHQVEVGGQLVLHGWTRQPKILATAGLHRYAIPLSYQGMFRVISRSFKGSSGLQHSFQKGQRLKVVEANPDPNDGPLPVREGDVIVVLGESVQKQGERSYIDCRKIEDHSGRTSDVFISSSWDITYEEILENLPPRGEGGAGLFSIRDFAAMIADHPFDVELISRGTDHLDPTTDLPTNTPINLCKQVVEPAVYASLSTPSAPAFHIPMRAPLYVRFIRQLPKSCSPLLTKQNALVSTLDRCVELLTPEVFHEVIANHRRIMQLFQQNGPNGVMTLPSTRSRGKRGLSSSQSQIDLREMTSSRRKGPMSTTGSFSSKFKWKFNLKRKGNRSTGGSSRAGSDFGSVRSLPVTNRKKSNRFQFLLSNGDRFDSPEQNQANHREFMRSTTNRRTPSALSATNHASDDESSIRPIPTVTARLSQRKSTTNKKRTTKTTIYEEVNGEETDEEIPRNQPSTDAQHDDSAQESSAHVKPRIRTNQNSDRKLVSGENLTNRIKDVDEERSNNKTERPLAANQTASTDYDAPRPRTNQLSVSGSDVISKGILRQSSFSSEARTTPSVSGSVSSNDANHGFRHLANGDGSMLSTASNAIILKSNDQSNHLQAKMAATPVNYQIPPGYALVPLNPSQTANAHGFAIASKTEKDQKQPSSSISVEQQRQQQQSSSIQQRHYHQDNSQGDYNSRQVQTNALASRAPSQIASDADTLREVSLNAGEDGFESEDDGLNSEIDSFSNSNNGQVIIPFDGNLYSFSAKKFSQFLFCLDIDYSVVQSCRKHRIDGRRFSRMTDVDLEKRGILHPVVLYFRKRTGKRTNNAMFIY